MFLQVFPHLPVLVLTCVVHYEQDTAPLAAHLLEVFHKRQAVEPVVLPHQPSFLFCKRAIHNGLVPSACPADCYWIPDARPQFPSIRSNPDEYGLVLHHDCKSTLFCAGYRACSVNLPPPHFVAAGCRGVLRGRSLRREPEGSHYPAHAAQAVLCK